ncbi:MAG: c-type cytochrome [Burkholderiales bacterium]|nr:c-type cytochrome [Burkholderiales bacterium]
MLAALLISAAHGQAEDRLAVHLRSCAGCHGADGNSVLPGTPSIAAQPRIFLENYLVMTREGIRGTQVMRSLLKGVPDREIVALAKHFSALKAKPATEPVDKKLFQRGKSVAAANRCGSCHLPHFRGREQMPRLAGQREEFLAETMLAYRQNRRPGGDTIMAASLYGIEEQDFKALAHYFSRLK